MIGRPKRKLLWCDGCGDERMCYAKSSFEYQCRVCDAKVNVVKAAGAAKRKRQEARAAKTGAPPPDQPYMAWVASLPCLRCGSCPSHAHHSTHRSQGGSDRTCVPLCHLCHGEYHDKLGSVPAALGAWGIDLRAEARRLNGEFDTLDSDPL